MLGAAIGTLATQGRDKLTISTNAEISSLGLWIEQIIAEGLVVQNIGKDADERRKTVIWPRNKAAGK